MNDLVESSKAAVQSATDTVQETARVATQKAGAACSTTTHEVESLVRQHPVWAVVATVGVGYAVGMLVRELLTPPPTPKNRALRVLEDIQSRLSDLVTPAYERASHYADDGMSAVKSGVNSLNDLHLGNRIKKFFS